MSSYPRLVAHVEVERVHVAQRMSERGPLCKPASLSWRPGTDLQAPLAAYLRRHACLWPRAAALGLAEPCGAVDAEDLQRRLALDRLVVVDEAAALALALPALSPRDLRDIGGGVPVPEAPRVLVVPGATLEVRGVLPGGASTLRSEAGLVSFTSDEPAELAVLDRVRREVGYLTAEAVLSAAGLVALHRAVRSLGGFDDAHATCDGILAAAIDRREPVASRSVAVYCALLGDFAGRVALVLGARGGVAIGGELVARLGDAFARSQFRQRFERQGRPAASLRDVPTCVVRPGAGPVLTGLAQVLEAAARDPVDCRLAAPEAWQSGRLHRS